MALLLTPLFTPIKTQDVTDAAPVPVITAPAPAPIARLDVLGAGQNGLFWRDKSWVHPGNPAYAAETTKA